MFHKLPFTVAVAQTRPLPGNVRANLSAMLKYIDEAKRLGAKLIVFPELATSAYLLGDRWEHDSFIDEIQSANETLRKASAGITVIWGSIKDDRSKMGEDGRRRKYNAAFIASNGAWAYNGALVGWIPKTNLPKYRMFDDARHFYPAGSLAREMNVSLRDLLHPFSVNIDGNDIRLALAVCEDLWEDEYNEKPSQIYAAQGTDLLVDISHSPWTNQKWHARDTMLRKRSRDAGAPILYVNAVGLQNNTKNLIWFDGNSTLIGRGGQFAWHAPSNKEGLFLCDLRNAEVPEDARTHVRRQTGIAEIHDALVCATRDFLKLFPRVVLGLSGGIDSAVAAAILVEALGPGKVLAVNMPTEHNSMTTRELAQGCAKHLGIEYVVSSIQDAYSAEINALVAAGEQPTQLVRENVQARIRGHRLAGIAACEGGVFTCNGNKTEVALNYFTLYGDGAGATSFLADLWKGQIYELARYINARAEKELIPYGIIDIVPSAELSAEQNVDEGKGDPIFYPYHDQLLRMFIEQRWDATMVLRSMVAGTLEKDLGCTPGTIRKYFPTTEGFLQNLEWAWRQYNIEYKRHQLPPVLITSRRAFGFDRRDTIADGYFTEDYFRMKEQLLGRPAA